MSLHLLFSGVLPGCLGHGFNSQCCWLPDSNIMQAWCTSTLTWGGRPPLSTFVLLEQKWALVLSNLQKITLTMQFAFYKPLVQSAFLGICPQIIFDPRIYLWLVLSYEKSRIVHRGPILMPARCAFAPTLGWCVIGLKVFCKVDCDLSFISDSQCCYTLLHWPNIRKWPYLNQVAENQKKIMAFCLLKSAFFKKIMTIWLRWPSFIFQLEMSENGHISAKWIFVLKPFYFINDLILMRFYNNLENLLLRLCADTFWEILHSQCLAGNVAGLVWSCMVDSVING